MSSIGNIIWFLFGGALTGFLWVVSGVAWSITIVGIPIGKQCFKIARLCFSPFGKDVEYGSKASSFLFNLLWIVFSGWALAVEASLIGLLYSITIVGIPFGKQFFKIAHLSLTPFGAKIYKRKLLGV